MLTHSRLIAACVGLLALAASPSCAQEVHSPTLDAVKQRGQLICGVDTGIPGYAFQDSAGNWKGLDIALCRGIADAVLGDPNKVKFVGLTSQVRFTVLKGGEIDVLIRNSEHTFVRNTQLGLAEPVVNFYTGQGFMVRKSLNVSSVKQLDGATICLETGTTLEKNIADYNQIAHVKIGTLLFDRPEQAFAAAEAGRCDGYTDDAGSVAAARSSMKVPGDWTVLGETISRSVLGPYTREGDENWTKIIKWTHYAMLEGEILGLTKANVVAAKKAPSDDPSQRKFFGVEGGFGKMLGVDDDWSFRIIRDVGNYGEVYDEFFGPKGLDLPRGMNNLWTNGGLQIPPPWYQAPNMVRLPSRRARRLQWVLLAAVFLLIGAIVANAAGNLAARHLGLSFAYLWAPAQFDIPFHLISWVTTDSYGRVLLVGLLNTALVSVAGIVAATLLGVMVGIMRLSANFLLRQLAGGFVELVRNTPQLIQIVFWYVAVLQALPGPRQSIVLLPGVLLNVRGLFVPRPIWSESAAPLLGLAAALCMLAVFAINRRSWRYAVLFAPAVLLVALAIEHVEWPALGGFNIRGGVTLPPEFVALWFGLSIYSAAFIAEIVRGAVEAVPRGQVEAARALGLRPWRVLTAVVLPQAVRMMVPPLTSQYLNLFKSSSLGAAIAFPEVFQIFAGTALNQSGREVETMSLVIAVFLSISLSVSALMNAYNRRISIERR